MFVPLQRIAKEEWDRGEWENIRETTAWKEQKFWVKTRAGWVTKPNQWEKTSLFPGTWLGIHCWLMLRRFVFGLRMNCREESTLWSGSVLLMKSNLYWSSIIQVYSKLLEMILLPPYAIWHEGVQRSPASNIPNSLSELSFSIFCFPFLFSLITF